MNTLIDCMYGLGDNLMAVPFIQQMRDVTIHTCWPQLYRHPCVRKGTILRTQTINANMYDDRFIPLPNIDKVVPIRYYPSDEISMIQQYEAATGIPYKLPDPIVIPRRRQHSKHAIVRSLSVRNEWYMPYRNPTIDTYVNMIEAVREAGYEIVEVGMCDQDNEQRLVDIHPDVLHNNTPLGTILEYMSSADLIITPIGWAAIYAQFHNVPTVVLPPQDPSMVEFASPAHWYDTRVPNNLYYTSDTDIISGLTT